MFKALRNSQPQFPIILIAALYAVSGSVTTLLGWIFEVQRFKDWNDGGITMKANTALCGIAAGTALLVGLCRRRHFYHFLSAFTALIGSITLFQHATGIDCAIDTLFFAEAPGATATAAPGRMGLPASISFTLIGTALLLISGSEESRKWAARVGLLVTFLAAPSIIGYTFGASQLYALPRVTGISLQAATIILSLAVALIASVSEHGLCFSTLRQDAGGALLRRLLLPIIFLPLVIGYLRVKGEQLGLYDSAFGTGARTVLEIALLLVIVWWTASSIGSADQKLRASETELRAANVRLAARADELDAIVAERTARLRESIQELEVFSYSIAHDMRAPLRSMSGFADVLLSEYSADLPPDARDLLTRIRRSALRLDQLTLDVLNYTKLGRQEMRQEPVDVKQLLNEIMESYPNLTDASSQLTFQPSYPPILANRAALAQVFSNLLGNALKFARPDRLAQVRIYSETAPNNRVRFVIEDNGIGIAPEDIPRLFNIFQRIHSESSYEGTGIGLALAKKATEQMGGTIGVDSEPNRGSRFWIEFNRAAGGD